MNMNEFLSYLLSFIRSSFPIFFIFVAFDLVLTVIRILKNPWIMKKTVSKASSGKYILSENDLK